VNVSDEEYKVLQKLDNCHWFCKPCDNNIGQLIPTIGKLNERLTSLEHEMSQVKNEFKSKIAFKHIELETKMDKRFQEIEDKIQTCRQKHSYR